jgi:hypothetical protein
MISFNYGILLAFGIVIYIMIVDPNVNEYIILLLKMIRVNVERVYWMIRLHPKNPITNLIMRWKYDKIAKELHAELIKNDKLSNAD